MAVTMFIVLCFVLVYSAEKPNIIFILSDDLGWDDVSWGISQQVLSPNLMKLKTEGQTIEWYYGQCVCSPTRSAIQTGRYPLHTGINDFISAGAPVGVPLNLTYISNILTNEGYHSHAVGKWHLGFYQWNYTATFRGYESFYGYYTGAEDYFTHIQDGCFDFHDEIGLNCGENCSRIATEAYGTYSVYLYTNRAIEIIKNHSAKYPKDPFFLYLPYQSVHEPHQVPKSFESLYNGSIKDQNRLQYAAMVTAMDQGIGNITSVLQELGYLGDNGNTIIVFSSDNGGNVPSGAKNGSTQTTSNYPLRGGKYTVYEGGTRLRSFIYATPDLIPKKLRNTEYTQTFHIVDWLPTLASAAGIDYTKYIKYKIDGVDQWKGLNGDANVDGDKYFYFRDNIWYGYMARHDAYKDYNNTAFRYKWNKLINGSAGTPDGWNPPPKETIYIDNNGDMTLTVAAKHNVSLYNISNDPNEVTDISKDNQDIINNLWNMMLQMEEDGVPNAVPNSKCKNVIHPNNSVVGPVWIPWCGYA